MAVATNNDEGVSTMIDRDNRWLALGVALGLAACAGQPTTRPDARAQEIQGEAVSQVAAPAQTTIAGINVEDLVKRLVKDRYTDYRRADDSYRHYIGGVLLAVYYVGERRLVLRPDVPPGVDPPQCEIRLQGDGGVVAQGDDCGTLLGRLQADLESDTAFAGSD